MLFANFLEQNSAFLLVIIIFWQILLTFSLFKPGSFYGKLKKDEDHSADRLIKNLAKKTELNETEIKAVNDQLKNINNKANSYFQKYAIIRFNPFEDSGGDQSFVIALLNKNNDGMIISSLHARDRTRVYAKPIIASKPTKYELSKEETEALKQAIDQKNDF